MKDQVRCFGTEYLNTMKRVFPDHERRHRPAAEMCFLLKSIFSGRVSVVCGEQFGSNVALTAI